jgi:MFS family permease
LHGAALGLVNWGIYFGYGLSYVFGNYVTEANINGQVRIKLLSKNFSLLIFKKKNLQGWRWAYYLSGLPGFIFATILLITTSDPRRSQEDKQIMPSQKPLLVKATLANAREFFRPFVLLLCLAACVRHTAGFAWAYNTQL